MRRRGGGGTVTTTPGATTPATTPYDTTPVTTPDDTTPVSTPDTTPVTAPAPPVTSPVTVPAPVRHAPVAKNDTTGTLLQANVAIDVLHNDTDVRVAVLYSGKLVFTYRICDTTGLCAQATVTATFTAAL